MAAKEIARDYGTVCADCVSGSALNSQEVPMRPSHVRYIPLTAPIHQRTQQSCSTMGIWYCCSEFTTFQLEHLYHTLCSGAPFQLRLEPSALARTSPTLLQPACAPASWLHSMF